MYVYVFCIVLVRWLVFETCSFKKLYFWFYYAQIHVIMYAGSRTSHFMLGLENVVGGVENASMVYYICEMITCSR